MIIMSLLTQQLSDIEVPPNDDPAKWTGLTTLVNIHRQLTEVYGESICSFNTSENVAASLVSVGKKFTMKNGVEVGQFRMRLASSKNALIMLAIFFKSVKKITKKCHTIVNMKDEKWMINFTLLLLAKLLRIFFGIGRYC